MEHKACPFCGEFGPELVKNNCGEFFVSCSDCGAAGPSAVNAEDARRNWNKRVTFHKTSPLFPCPFCGKLGVQMMRDSEPVGLEDHEDDGEVWARCPYCLTYGPDADTPVEAIRKWNIREG